MRRLMMDGTDDEEGRGLMILSALSLIADELAGVEVRILNGECPVIRTAAESLSWDAGLTVSIAPPSADPSLELAGASLYVAVVASGTAHLHLQEAAAAGVPSIVAVQFPGQDLDARTLSLARAAHDPRVLGRAILAELERLR